MYITMSHINVVERQMILEISSMRTHLKLKNSALLILSAISHFTEEWQARTSIHVFCNNPEYCKMGHLLCQLMMFNRIINKYVNNIRNSYIYLCPSGYT